VKISNFRVLRRPEATQMVASIAWEDCPREPLELFFETDADLAGDFEPQANAFLLAGILPAFRNRERRLSIEGSVCPLLCEGLETVMSLQRAWYGRGREVAIEPSRGRRPSIRGPARAGMYFTGGVDSLHTLWWNRRNYPPGHPSVFRDAIYVEGLSFPEEIASARNQDVTQRQRRAVAAIAADCDLSVLPLRSNIRMLEPDNVFVAREGLSCLLASMAHVFCGRLTSVSFAAALDLQSLVPWGTHPLLDANYASTAIEFRQEDWTLERQTKIQHIVSWKPALQHMMVCLEGPLSDGRLNCGQCEKCVRTMVGLLAAGRLAGTEAFLCQGITPETLDGLELIHHLRFLPNFWSPFVEPLRALGREDLAQAVERLVARARRKERWLEERDWKGAVRKFDRKRLGGVLLRTTRRIRGIPLAAQPLP
jgi:hypothetical protein